MRARSRCGQARAVSDDGHGLDTDISTRLAAYSLWKVPSFDRSLSYCGRLLHAVGANSSVAIRRCIRFLANARDAEIEALLMLHLPFLPQADCGVAVYSADYSDC